MMPASNYSFDLSAQALGARSEVVIYKLLFVVVIAVALVGVLALWAVGKAAPSYPAGAIAVTIFAALIVPLLASALVMGNLAPSASSMTVLPGGLAISFPRGSHRVYRWADPHLSLLVFDFRQRLNPSPSLPAGRLFDGRRPPGSWSALLHPRSQRDVALSADALQAVLTSASSYGLSLTSVLRNPPRGTTGDYSHVEISIRPRASG